MGFWKKVGEEIEFRGISRKELSAKSGVPMTTINRAMERDSNPFAVDALRIANSLSIPLENLLEISNDKNSAITEENRDFIKQWNRLSRTQQEKLIDFLKAMKD